MFPVRYEVVYSPEWLWFIAGLIVGALLMAVVDFVIDRIKK